MHNHFLVFFCAFFQILVTQLPYNCRLSVHYHVKISQTQMTLTILLINNTWKNCMLVIGALIMDTFVLVISRYEDLLLYNI